jgi:opacity protein-like surface antigen
MVCAGLAGLACGGAFAQDWQLEATPYLWAAGMKGDVGVGSLSANGVEATFPDIAKSLRAGFMGSIEGRKDRFGFLVDAIYMQLNQTHPAPHGFLGDVHAKPTQQSYTVAAIWRAVPGEQPVDLFLGARTNYIKLDLDLSSSALAPNGRTVVKSRSWVDGFVGARIRYPVATRWTLVGYADIGAGGSDSTWQFSAGADYAVSPTATAKFGYRLIKADYHKDDFLYDMSSGGLYAGIGLRF